MDSQILHPSLACVPTASVWSISQLPPCFQEEIITGKCLHPCKSPFTNRQSCPLEVCCLKSTYQWNADFWQGRCKWMTDVESFNKGMWCEFTRLRGKTTHNLPQPFRQNHKLFTPDPCSPMNISSSCDAFARCEHFPVPFDYTTSPWGTVLSASEILLLSSKCHPH